MLGLILICSKSTDSGICMRCFYCKRGSFPKMNMHEFLQLIFRYPALRTKWLVFHFIPGLFCFCTVLRLSPFVQRSFQELRGRIKTLYSPSSCCFFPRFLGMRKKHLVQVTLNPKSRPRHETINVKLFTQKKKFGLPRFFWGGELGIGQGEHWPPHFTTWVDKLPPFPGRWMGISGGLLPGESARRRQKALQDSGSEESMAGEGNLVWLLLILFLLFYSETKPPKVTMLQYCFEAAFQIKVGKFVVNNGCDKW